MRFQRETGKKPQNSAVKKEKEKDKKNKAITENIGGFCNGHREMLGDFIIGKGFVGCCGSSVPLLRALIRFRHLRFKFTPNTYTKRKYRVIFPFENFGQASMQWKRGSSLPLPLLFGAAHFLSGLVMT